MLKIVNFGEFLKIEACGQTVLQEGQFQKGKRLVESVKIENIQMTHFG